jgi:serine/threonine-protein kinase
MGSNDGEADEKPIHTVNLDAFWIDQTEVTNAMYAKCVQDANCSQPSDTTRYDNSDYANHPVVFVSWNDAETYCSWAHRRLPTEAEWEKAARGTAGRTYPWGNKPTSSSLLNYNSERTDETAAVGSYPEGASPYGALDMAGNVWEWVADWYNVYPGGDPTESTDFGQKKRVMRGGSWTSSASSVRSANRGWDNPTSSSVKVGFRCATSASP